ncbi:hypothetical protein DVH24_041997 [Malus domestica]|uniref:Uncharacterized protein n=1 Tax=Malus domestica TaxID=3750 RepID=A0A498IPW6_MALDO|nr:hypothetical protein DVH24_041997 [Malus domestica]
MYMTIVKNPNCNDSARVESLLDVLLIRLGIEAVHDCPCSNPFLPAVSLKNILDLSPCLYMSNTENATDPTREAAGEADKFATNQANVSGLISVYSLEQCTHLLKPDRPAFFTGRPATNHNIDQVDGTEAKTRLYDRNSSGQQSIQKSLASTTALLLLILSTKTYDVSFRKRKKKIPMMLR